LQKGKKLALGNWIKNESFFAGVQIRQNHVALLAFNIFFSQQRFGRVIEFGTGWGGFTLFLAMVKLVHNCELYSFDTEKIPNTDVRQFLTREIKVFGGYDIFTQNEFINSLIAEEGKRVLVLCDNGDKPREFNEFSKYLKNNDVIMCHDYYKTREEFESDTNKTWEWCEITRSDIQQAIDNQYLCETYIECFKDAHWGCFVKNNPREIGFKPAGYMLFPNEINAVQI
jgi:hypothetical protein